ncbi:hypothetical protein [Haliangium sp.]
MSGWLISLPFDLKILFEAVDDENLERSARELVLGAIIYAVSPNDAIADRHDSFVSYCDDCLMLRLALKRSLYGGGDDAERFRSRFPEFFATLPDELEICKQVLGAEVYDWLASKVDGLTATNYKGKSVSDYLTDGDSASLLYEDGLAFATDYPIEEESLRDKFKKASTVVDFMQRRRLEDSRGAG